MGRCSQRHGVVAWPSARRRRAARPRARKGRSQQQCHHRVVCRACRRGRMPPPRSRSRTCWGQYQQQRQHQVGPGRVSAVAWHHHHRYGRPQACQISFGHVPLARARAVGAREGYSPFSVLALRAFSMIWVGESKSSVLALPGATHSSRCLTAMPMFST